MSALLELTDVVKRFRRHGSTVHAVDGVSLAIEQGTTYGLVGESGSGKSTLARCALRLIVPSSGMSSFDGCDLGSLGTRQLRRIRADMGMVFQNPVAALNPRMRIAALIAEPIVTHTKMRGSALRDRINELLDDVGLAPEHATRLPHQLSGGQCQRVGIARALATRPRLIVLDEPTSALDVSVQAQILNLLQGLRTRHSLTYMLISHDLDVVRYMSDTVGVMRRGVLVEEGQASFVLETPRHEYTRQLLSSTPGHRGIEGKPMSSAMQPSSDEPRETRRTS